MLLFSFIYTYKNHKNCLYVVLGILELELEELNLNYASYCRLRFWFSACTLFCFSWLCVSYFITSSETPIYGISSLRCCFAASTIRRSTKFVDNKARFLVFLWYSSVFLLCCLLDYPVLYVYNTIQCSMSGGCALLDQATSCFGTTYLNEMQIFIAPQQLDCLLVVAL